MITFNIGVNSSDIVAYCNYEAIISNKLQVIN